MAVKRIAAFGAKHWEKLFFLILSLAVFFPLLRYGYVLTLDMIFTPQMSFHFPPVNDSYSTLPLMLILNLAAKIIPAHLIQKLILASIFFIIPFGFYKFLELFTFKGKFTKVLKVLASSLYLWNPFVYSRLLAGHWLFLAGYALTPVFVFFLIRLYNSKEAKDIKKYFLLTVGLWLLTSLLSLHHFFLYGIIFGIFSLAFLIKTKSKAFPKFIATTLISLLVNFIWIAPTLLYGRNLSLIGQNDLTLFAASPDSALGVSGNLITFYGFWAEKALFALPKDFIPSWPLAFILILFPFLYLAEIFIPESIRRKYKNKVGNFKIDKNLIVGFLILLVSGLILAHGSLGIAKPVYDLFYYKIPLLKAFREPQKFLSLYILSFCTLFYISFNIMIEQLKKENYRPFSQNVQKRFKEISIIALIIAYFVLTFLLSFKLFWGARGQLKVTDFPESWYLTEHLTKNTKEKILILPYQSYAKFGFNKRRIANPAPAFFTTQVISRQTLKELAIDEYDIDCLCLDIEDSADDWYESLKEAGINYVLVNKNDEWEDYDFLRNSNRFEEVLEDDFSYLLKVSM